MMKEVKSPITYKEQIDRIIQKGFIIEDRVECMEFLQEANYYRLSAYLLPFRIKNDEYIRDIDFKKIQGIYCFDQGLREILFPIIEKIEFYLRTQLAYYHGHRYGSLGYLDKTNFNKKHNAAAFKHRLNTVIKENEKTPIVMHHNKYYGGQFPIWVIIEFFSIGMLSYFYGDMKLSDKKLLARSLYQTSYKNVDSWLRCLTDIRNRCAHYSRLYFWRFTAVPKGIRDFVTDERSLFAQILMLKSLYPSKDQWNSSFTVKMEALIEQYKNVITLDHIGFPSDWTNLLRM